MTPLIIILVVVALLVFALIAMYNKLVRLRQNVRESWSSIDTELRRRYDLIPNLVETVKGYATHEKSTLDAVIQARNSAMAAPATADAQATAQNGLSGALRQVFALSEAYPELKANTNFLQLQGELGETETRISQARRFYNANVRELNTSVETFPSSLLAGSFGFSHEPYFELDEPAARQAVAVKF